MGKTRPKSTIFDDVVPKFSRFQGKSGALSLLNPPIRSFFRGVIDVYQNKGRFLYRYAGAFLENAAKLCFQERYAEADSVRIPNTQGRRPRTFEIDCLIEQDAIEIKWRDATTDGDHITKEHTRIRTIVDAGYTPVRVMFYYPNRAQAIRIQQTLETLYAGVNGEYYYGDEAWDYVKRRTGIDLKAILEKLAEENTQRS